MRRENVFKNFEKLEDIERNDNIASVSKLGGLDKKYRCLDFDVTNKLR